ncbi:MAG: hypothetical protein HYZ28_22340 [Myxococcales bacterium]|nr:hypothetical protein [Myxococcales bacterium]
MARRIVAVAWIVGIGSACNCQPGVSGSCKSDFDCGPAARCESQRCVEVAPAQPSPACAQGDRRSCGTDVGACASGQQLCGGDDWGPCVSAVGPAQETCDGQDHDCDGTPNNRPGGCDCTDGQTRSCFNNPPPQLGQCRAGTQACVDGKWGACQNAVEPQPGNCAQPSCAGGPNPGCPCTVGDQASCYSGPAGTAGIGACLAGKKMCVASATGADWSACVGEVVPSAEKCDSLDHDCDGAPYNPPGGCTCASGQSQSCYSGPPGTLGVGTCAAGTQSCVLDASGKGSWGPCVGEVAPVPSDCSQPSCTGPADPNPGCACINAQTQACYGGPAGTQNVGACVGGTRACVSGAWASCSGEVVPQAQDSCVPPNAAYASWASADLTCSGALERHQPEVAPTAGAPGAQPLTPPPGHAHALEVPPLVTVTFQGNATDVDGPTSFSYEWRLVSTPQGNTAALTGAPGGQPTDISTQQSPMLFAQLAGDYVVGVRALDATGCASTEATVLVRVKPNSAIHLQLTWDKSVDVDLQLGRGTSAALFSTDACYWGALNPDWGAVDPTLDIDDVAACNPENVNFGAIGGTAPALGSDYTVLVHYYCDRRGHRPDATNPAAVCYEPTAASGSVNVTLRVFVDGSLAKLADGVTPAELTTSLSKYDFWKPVTLHYDVTGVWRINTVTPPAIGQSPTNCDTAAQASCVCSQLTNAADPYCGTSGAACRQKYP